MQTEILPTSIGLLRCLQAVAEETRSLGLTQTHMALQQAISLCRAEMSLPPGRAEWMGAERLH